MKYTLVSGCSTSIDIDTLALTITNVKYVELDVTLPTLAQLLDNMTYVTNYVPRTTTSYVVLNVVVTESGKETDYVILGRVVGDEVLKLKAKSLLRFEGDSYVLIDGAKPEITSINQRQIKVQDGY